jgi:proline dehydrogenase
LEKERHRAQKEGYASPIHPTKADTDRAYNQALDYALQHLDELAFCAATHNEESCHYLIEQMDEQDIPPDHERISICQLYGMGDHITFNLAQAGYNISKYVPYGPVKEVIPYLIRRAQENSSIGGQMSRELRLLSKELERRKNQ